MHNDITLNVDEVAALLHAECGTVMHYARRGELPGTRIGKSWVFMRDDVIAFLKQQIAMDTEERRQQAAVAANAVLVPIAVNKRRRKPPVLPSPSGACHGK